MTSAKILIVKCPICQTAVEWLSENRFKPFCSERCKLIDLGDWATETHKIPGDTINNPDIDNFDDLV